MARKAVTEKELDEIKKLNFIQHKQKYASPNNDYLDKSFETYIRTA